jgi:hypothetical protein
MLAASIRHLAQSLTLRWLLANGVVAIVTEYPFLALYYLLLDPDNFEGRARSAVEQMVIVALAAISWSMPAVLYGVLTALILKGLLPAFKKRHWIGLHVFCGLVLSVAASAIVTGYVATGNPGERLRPWANLLLGTDVLSYAMTDNSYWKLLVIGGVPMIASPTVATIAGAIIGSIQALVLRGATRELVVWIGVSTLAAASGAIVGSLRLFDKSVALLKLIDPETARRGYAPNDAYHKFIDWIFMVIASSLLVLPTIVAASVMLVAMHRLRPC